MDKLLKSMDLDKKEYKLLDDILLHIDNNAKYDSFIKKFSKIEEKTIETTMKKLAKIIDKYNFNGILKILEENFIRTDSYEKQKSIKGGFLDDDDDDTWRPTPNPGKPTLDPTRRPTLSQEEIERERNITIFLITFGVIVGSVIVLDLILRLILIVRSSGIIGSTRRSIGRNIESARRSIGRNIESARRNIENIISYQRIIIFYNRLRTVRYRNQIAQCPICGEQIFNRCRVCIPDRQDTQLRGRIINQEPRGHKFHEKCNEAQDTNVTTCPTCRRNSVPCNDNFFDDYYHPATVGEPVIENIDIELNNIQQNNNGNTVPASPQTINFFKRLFRYLLVTSNDDIFENQVNEGNQLGGRKMRNKTRKTRKTRKIKKK